MSKINNKGITLIALVITIIVLIILAGVAISMLFGDNGILRQVASAKEKTELAQKEEENILQDYADIINDLERRENAIQWSGGIATSFSVGDGTEQNPYQISNGEELALLAEKVNNGENQQGIYYIIVNDINLMSEEWTPIGGNQPLPKAESGIDLELTNIEEKFEGTLYGNDKIIYGLNINKIDLAAIGLVGILGENGTIDGITIGDGNIQGGQEVGAIAGVSHGSITNCKTNSTVTAVDDANIVYTGQSVGGISGDVRSGTIDNCINTGTITAKNECDKTGRGKYAGGIAGYMTNSFAEIRIKDCINEGHIIAEYQQSGGIVASNGSKAVGGTLTIENCTNKGKVETKYNSALTNSGIASGGIMGLIYDSTNVTIIDCTNQGEIIAECNYPGGIVGQADSGTISLCKNSGTVITKLLNARGLSGGIVGVLQGTVEKCYNTGKVYNANYNDTTVDASGGIVGLLLSSGTVTQSYSNCEFEGGDAIGNIVGQWNTSSTASVSDCKYTTITEGIKGIGSKGTNNTVVTAVEDSGNGVEAVEKINSFEDFMELIEE